jgi:isochorismate synthase
MLELTQEDGFVFYQKPHSNVIYFLSGKWEKFDLKMNPKAEGFIISNANKSTTYFLKGEAVIISSDCNIDLNYNAKPIDELKKKQYLRKAELFIEACRNDVKKIILSRIKKYITNDTQKIFQTYINLCENYNHSLNYLLNIPNEGAWMGATPEILIEGKNKKYKTVALAGSKPAANIEWKQKEIDEQQFVTDYISEKLKKASISFNYNKTSKTAIAGNIAHLQTTFNIETGKNPLALADLLHPTPAICGLPQTKAQNFILKNEGYNREFYTGFLGIVNNSASSLFVNLRCMQLFKNEYWLYVGGGITANSEPNNEWDETELKAQTLLNILD